MKKKTKDKLDTEIDNYIERTINILSGNAGLAFIAGEIKASGNMGISYDKPSPDSLVYARAYRQLLVDEGATIINGEKVYWMADREKELREQLFNKIEEGFKEGRKTYGSGSIADDIAEILGVEHWKAQRISRTEVKRIMNAGTIQRYERNKVKYVQVLDNEGENSCEECAKINGQKWDIEYANSHELEHPNCFIDFQVPIFTVKGWKQIGNIQIGDLVLTHKGRFRKVIKLIHTLKQRPNIVTIEIGNSNTNNKKISVTEDHPILTNEGWKKAKDLTIQDEVKVLAKNCQCGELIPYWKTVCKLGCNSKATMLKLRENPEWVKKSQMAQKKRMQDIYSNPLNRKKQTKNARIKSMELLENNNHPFQKIETHIKSNRVLSQNKYKTYLEKKVEWLLKQMNLNFESQPIIFRDEIVGNRKRYYKPDFILNDHKIIIECDGDYWHDKNNQYEIERQKYLESLGYTVIRFSESDIRNNLNLCQTTLTRVLMNHNHEYNFLALKIKSIKHWLPNKAKKLYNFSVEEDESYIAKGIIVHNCVRSFVPIFDEELPEGFVPDNQIEEEELIEYDWLTEAKDREDLTPEMEKGLQDYTATSFPINAQLRHGDDENFTLRSSSEQYLRDIGAIKDIFNLETSAMQEDTVLWRGVDRQAIALMKRASKDPYGETLLDKGFLSTSLDKDIALMFGADMDKREVILIKILCPKGTRGINIGQSYTYDQKEVLLQNSSVLHIVSEDTRGVTNEEIKQLYELGATMDDAENTKVKIYTVEFKGSLDDYYED